VKTLLLGLLLAFGSLCSAGAIESLPSPSKDYHGASLHTLSVEGQTLQVLAPKAARRGRPWILAPSLYNLESMPVGFMGRTQLALVKDGFHVVVAPLGNTFGAPQAIAKWDPVYREMTEKYGFHAKVSLMGVSREGLSIARWAARHPGKAACLYMDKAVCDFKSWPGGKLGTGKGSPKDWESLLPLYGFANESEALAYAENPIDLAPKLAADGVAIVYVGGGKDDGVPVSENGARMQAAYAKAGGVFKMILRENEGHHPHGLEDPAPVVDFLHYHAFGNPERIP
jgi:hypothetical protein